MTFKLSTTLVAGILAYATVAGAAHAAEAATPARTEPELAGVERLLAMEEMKNDRLTFCRALDARDWDALRSVMADDFELDWKDVSGANPPLLPQPVKMKGADAFVTFAKTVLAQGKSDHVCTMPQFVFVGRDHARALWHISGLGQIAGQSGEGFERVVENYVRVNGKWLSQKADVDIIGYAKFPK
jgi:hypothetical protein